MVSYVTDQALRPLRLGSGQASTSSGRTEAESDGERLPVRAESFDQLRTGSVEARTALPADLIDAVVARTDGVPLFVEELTKSVVESVGAHGRAPLQALDIPATLQDSLMARLDRLGTAKEVAQLGATIGREFSYELLQAVSPLDEVTLQRGLKQLVEAELVYQRGLVPQAHYLFKHALIQDTAYQALLKSTRQQSHTKIAQVLADRFPETVETQPELVAQHYTEAGLMAQAIPYWQRAGQRASQRSAHAEAINHLTRGLELLKTLPDTPERAQQELFLQTALGPVLIATKGNGAPEVEKTYTRALELCRQVGETPQLFPVLFGLRSFYLVRVEYKTAHELGEQLLRLAQSVHDSDLLLEAHVALANSFFFLGEYVLALAHLEQGISLYDSQEHRSHAFLYGLDPGVFCLSRAALVLAEQGYPDQALKRIGDALTLAQELAHPVSLAFALFFAAVLNRGLGERQAVQAWTEAVMTLANEHGFPFWLAVGTIMQGWALAVQGQGEEGIAQIRRGLAALRATGGESSRTYYLARLADAYEKAGQAEEGLNVLAEALAFVDRTGERMVEGSLYWRKGTLTLQSKVQGPKSKVEKEAEDCFWKAIEIARRQRAKLAELRAVMSLSQLWQSQGKKEDARRLLAEIYEWFTEGFDTTILKEAQALLAELT